MSGTVSWEMLVFMLTALIAGIGLAFAIWKHITSYVQAETGETKRDLINLTARHAAFRDDFAAEKLATANRYVSVEHLREVESRMVSAVEKIDHKIDQILARQSGRRSGSSSAE